METGLIWEPRSEGRVLHPPSSGADPFTLQLSDLLPRHYWVSTSGSTASFPRWVALSFDALIASACAANRHVAATASDVWLNVLPTHHVGGLGVHVRAEQAGCKLIDRSLERWNPLRFREAVDAEDVTLTSLVPTQLFDLVAAELAAPKGLRAVVVGGGALREDLYRAARSLGWPVLPSFGMTECGSQIATASLDSLTDDKYPAMILLDHFEARIQAGKTPAEGPNSSGGEHGVLELKGASLLTAYAEYKNHEWVLEDPKVGGWFRTSDRAQLNGSALVPLGRESDLIKVRGELVSVSLIEALVKDWLGETSSNRPKLSERALVVATADPRAEHRLVLVLEGCEPTFAEEVRRAVNLRLRAFERIEKVLCLKQIPRTALGKPKRVEITQLIEAGL